jgi:hypothetical protein
MSTSPHRARRADSLAAAVVELVDTIQLPVPTTAVRMILSDKGRSAGIAVYLCRHLADQPSRTNPQLVAYTLGLAGQLFDLKYFETPLSSDGWMELHRRLYAPYNGALNNLGGFTPDQHEAAEQLRTANLPAVALFFGRSSR